MKRKNQRKSVIVDWRVQVRIILATSLPMIACLVLAIVGEIVYYRAAAKGWIQTDGTILGLRENRLGMLLLFASASTVQLVASLLASQKVAGVAYHIARILKTFREGDRQARVRLRKGDYQVELGDDVNEFLDWISGDATSPLARPAASAGRPEPGRPEGRPAATALPRKDAAR